MLARIFTFSALFFFVPITLAVLRIGADGERVTGVGTISGTADVLVRSADMETVLHCNTGVCMGAFSGESRTVIVSVVSRSEVLPLKRIVREEDEKSFVFITDTHETLGEGFETLSGE